MSAFLLLIAIGAVAAVIFWYVLDEALHNGSGTSGFFGMRDGRAPKGETGASGWRSTYTRKPWRRR